MQFIERKKNGHSNGRPSPVRSMRQGRQLRSWRYGSLGHGVTLRKASTWDVMEAISSSTSLPWSGSGVGEGSVAGLIRATSGSGKAELLFHGQQAANFVGRESR